MPSPGQPKFDELHFGLLDAGEEASDEPSLLLDGYYDYREAAYGAMQGKVWVLLGPKGAGKSAVLEHIRLRWEDRWDRFFQYWNLATFPVADISQISAGGAGGASRATASWDFLFWLRIVELLAKDEGVKGSASFNALVKGLRNRGYLEGDWLTRVTRWAGGAVRFDAKVIGAEGKFESEEITPLELASYLRTQVLSVRTSSRHIIAVDGLDSFFFESNDDWASLSGLMSAVWNINKALAAEGLPVNLLVAARSDIIDVLPGPELNKLKTHTVYLDWHAHGIGSKNHLWRLVSQKAGVSRPEVRNLVNQYMANRIAIGPHTYMPEYLLDHTRLIPRDLVALLTQLQRNYRGNGNVTEAAAKAAVERYCEEYFVGEIFDNLAGILPPNKARELSSFKDALRTAPTRRFTYDYLKEELEDELSPKEIKDLLKQMFEVGGIGIQNSGHTDFVFRRTSGGAFSTRYTFVLHDALTRAWNRKWS